MNAKNGTDGSALQSYVLQTLGLKKEFTDKQELSLQKSRTKTYTETLGLHIEVIKLVSLPEN